MQHLVKQYRASTMGYALKKRFPFFQLIFPLKKKKNVYSCYNESLKFKDT